MAKIQLDTASMIPVAGKTGRPQPSEKGAFNRLLKNADRKPAGTSDSNPGKKQSVSEKDETPVKDGGPKGKEEPENGEALNGEKLSAEQFLLLQGVLNQPAAAMPEEVSQNPDEMLMVPEEILPVVPEAAEGMIPETVLQAVPEETAVKAASETPVEITGDVVTEKQPVSAGEEILPETEALPEEGPVQPASREDASASGDTLTGVPSATEQAAEAAAQQPKETEDLSSFVLRNARQDLVEADEQKTAQKVKDVAVETRAAVEKFQADISRAAGVQQTGKPEAAQEENRPQTETGQETWHWQAGVLPAESRSSFSVEAQTAEPVPVQTSEANLVNDVARTIADRFPQSNGTLTIELEPASLGKLTIQVLYEGGKATVSILASNPRTLELLNQKATEMASILEERTGQDTIVYTEPPESRQPYEEERQGGGREREQEPEEKEQKKKSEGDSFAQQLRLGLI